MLISGYDGGTGAAPLTSLKHAGAPWEIGLADTQQTLVLNGLRDRITVQCDGGMRTARDVMVAALLGAEEFGFSTAPLVVAGCIMMRVCHLDTCPVGVATQNPELRARFNGKPEFVENFFRFIAEDVRKMLAELGFRSIDEAVGHAEVLDTDAGVAHWKSKGLDLSPIFAVPTDAHGAQLPQRRRLRDQDHGLEHALDQTLIALAEGALEDAHPVRLELPVRNVNRTVGTLLGSEVTRRYGAQGLPDGHHSHHADRVGRPVASARSCRRASRWSCIGDANDYVGKGLSGGRVIVRPPDDVLFLPEDNVIAGNTLLYGATSGEVYLRGRVGERFCARNSGALAVTEGVGDHACEYMTGGRVVVLGPHRAQHGGRDVRRYRLRARPGSGEGQHRDGRAAAPRPRRPGLAARRRRPPRPLHRQHAGHVGAVRLAKAQCAIHQGHAHRLPAGAARPPGWPRPKGATWTPRSWRRPVADPTGFLKVAKIEAAKRPVDERVGDWREVYERQDPHERAGEVSQQARRCMDCGIPFCHSGTAGCPLGNLIPEWNDLVRRGRWDAASDRLHATNNFPEFTGRLCPAPCEAACVLSIAEEQTGGSVTIKRIENTIVDQAWRHGIVEPQPAAIGTGKNVAVVGSGPAGLAAAQQLTRAGHHVTVYERDDRLGGLLRYGIPEYKLEKADAQPAAGPDAGRGNAFRHRLRGRCRPVRRRAAAPVRRRRAGGRRAARPRQRGRGPPPQAACTWRWNTWCRPTRNARATGRRDISAKGKHVVIIGGGDTGADCLGTAHRQGAASVTQLDYNPQPPDVARRRAVAVAHLAAGAAHLARARRGRHRPLPGGRAALRR